jgi:predicted Zn finger-like uncharacterized protein
MIIECVNCFKKFNVDSELIPDEGRSIQCGACNHVWFFNKAFSETSYISNPKIEKKDVNKDFKESNLSPDLQPEGQKNLSDRDDINLFDQKDSVNINDKPKTSFTVGKLLSYIIVSIVSFIAIILTIDTFKLLLYDVFPNLEFLMFSFYETLKDLVLFINDLI